jgi:alginate O-acetyltransferase complex protein AlgI
MLFNSYEYIFFFLPTTFLIYFFLNKHKLTIGSKIFLLLSSLFFYSWWNPIYLPLILASIIFNYLIGTLLTKHETASSGKKLLTFGVLTNLGLLAYFKYLDFFLFNINFAFATNFTYLNLALPLAISFFTFQQIAYLVDSFYGKTKEYNFLNYAVFVSFFPQLIAGPIVHHKEMMPQFERIQNKFIIYKNIAAGLFIFSIGLFKKVVLADTFAIWAINGFDTAETLNFLEAWITSLSYTFQLYFDFSGYTDMALGSALLFNIRLPNNFNSPYKALDIQDFWRRWHITLSHFLRDYIYIPLGGNRKGEISTYSNLMITFIVGGIWHGAGWNFAIWGVLHGLAMVILNLWRKLGLKMPVVIAWFITFNFINITWVFFRAKEWKDALKIFSGMFGMNGIVLPGVVSSKLPFLSAYGIQFGNTLVDIGGNKYTFIIIITTLFITLYFPNSVNRLSRFKATKSTLLQTYIIFIFGILCLSNPSEFLYFNF